MKDSVARAGAAPVVEAIAGAAGVPEGPPVDALTLEGALDPGADIATPAEPVTLRTVFATWWPLAVSWLFMGLELPAVSAGLARLPNPTVSLAAYGGVVFPIALLIESPIVMLLTASTAVCKDLPSYQLVRRFMFVTSGALVALHGLVAFTPLFDIVVGRIIAPPAEVIEPSRLGMQIMLPWTLAIAYRRFQQGVMIRFGHARSISVGTAVRLCTNVAVLVAGFLIQTIPGIVVGTLAVTLSVVAEAVFAGIVVRRVVRDEMPHAAKGEPLTLARFVRFYTPLALTPTLLFAAMPIGTAAMSRMPLAMESLATWPVISGFAFTLRSTGFALNEVVVALLERPRALRALRRFAWTLGAVTSGMMLLVAATPLGHLWFERVAALSPVLLALATTGAWWAFLLPGGTALQSLYQGAIVHSGRTRSVTESMAIYLLMLALVLAAGVAFQRWTGLFVALAAVTAGLLAQVGWLAWRARASLRTLAAEDTAA